MNSTTKNQSKDTGAKKEAKGAKAKGKAAAKAETKTKKAVEKATGKGKLASFFGARQFLAYTEWLHCEILTLSGSCVTLTRFLSVCKLYIVCLSH